MYPRYTEVSNVFLYRVAAKNCHHSSAMTQNTRSADAAHWKKKDVHTLSQIPYKHKNVKLLCLYSITLF